VQGDLDVEPHETFTVTLSNPSVGTLGQATATGTIENDDTEAPSLPELSIEATDADKREGDTGDAPATEFTFTVTRTGDMSAESTVTWTATPNTTDGVSADDFVFEQVKTDTLTFAAEDTSPQEITLLVQGDTTPEPTEGFTVTLSEAQNATIGQARATGTIQDDDGEPMLSIAAVNAVQDEGNTGDDPATEFTFKVTRTGDLSGSSTVNWEVSGRGDTQAFPEDFVGGMLPSSTLTFDPEVSEKEIIVSVNGDMNPEFDEGFTVALSEPTNADISQATATGTILSDDNDQDTVIGFGDQDQESEQDEGNIGSHPYVFTLFRQGALGITSSVEVAFNAGTTTDSDFAVLPEATQVVEFGPNESTREVTVEVSGDTEFEPDETFSLSLQNPVNAEIGIEPMEGDIFEFTIKNDDDEPGSEPVHSIAPSKWEHPEGDDGNITPYIFAVTRTGPDLETEGSSVNVVFNQGDTDSFDFGGPLPVTQLVEFGPGEDSKLVTYPVIGDTDATEDDETFSLSLESVDNAVIDESAAEANGVIKNDDALPTISIAPKYMFPEGDSGAQTPFRFQVTRSGDLGGPSSVQVAFDQGSTNGEDFAGGLPTTQTVDFLPNMASRDISYSVAGDDVPEGEEIFNLVLQEATGAVIDDANKTAEGIIQEDDANSIYISDVQIEEGNDGSTTDAVFTVSLSSPVNAPVTVDFATADGTATAGSDYTAVSGTLTFASGETEQEVRVPITGDGAVEPNESFFVNLSNPVNDVIADGQGEATIIDDDGALNRTGTNADEVFDGTDGDDVLQGGNGDDALTGAGGDDALTGGAGDDAIDGGAGDDILAGGSGDDTLDGGTGDDTMGGGSGNDVLQGGAGDDTLVGGSGDDQLSGGAGNDALIGGSGNDAFVFTAADGDAGQDTIRLFNADEDTLRFEDFGERMDAFSDLDTNANSVLDDDDAHVSVDAGNTVIDLGGQTDGASEGTLTLVGVTGLEADDISFG